MCVILAWGCQVAELNNVTVSDRDGGLPSVGEGQSSINLKKFDTRERFTYNIM